MSLLPDEPAKGQKDRQPPAESWRTPALFNSPPRGAWRWVSKRRGKPLLWPELKWFHLRGGRPQKPVLDMYECLRAVVGAKRAKEIFVEAELDIDLRADPEGIPVEKWDKAIEKLEAVKRQLSRERKRRGKGILSY
jgi:hypothetical protein